MQVTAMQGYFDNGVFYHQGRVIALPDRKMVIINVLDMPAEVDVTQKTDAEFWKGFDEQTEAMGCELLMTDFPRLHFEREFALLDDEVSGS